MKFSHFILLGVVLFFGHLSAQHLPEKKGKSFYLVDSIDLDKLNATDRQLLDSMLIIHHRETNDTNKLGSIKILSEFLSDQTLWPKYNRLLYNLVKDRTDILAVNLVGQTLNNMGYEAQYIRNDIPLAIIYYDSAYKVFKRKKLADGMAVELNNLAYIYQHQGNTKKAIDLYSEARQIFENQNNILGNVSCLINLGDIYFKNNETEHAENYFWRALVLSRKLNQPQVVANVYNQLGAIQKRKKNLTLAIYFYQKAFEIYAKYDNFSRMSTIDLAWANCLDPSKNQEKVLSKYKNALRNANLSGDFQVMSKAYDNASQIFYKIGNFSVAKNFADSAALFARKLGFPDLIHSADLSLAKILYEKKAYKMAYDYLLEAQVMNDSLYNDKNKNDLLKLEYKSDYEKQALLLKADQDKKEALNRIRRRQTQRIIYLTTTAAILISIFAVFAFMNYRKARRAKMIIEAQKNQVEAQKELISLQKEAVEEKQKEVLDSIHYASKIQTATLTDKEIWNKISKQHFILYMPKDIVSGDFYWAFNTVNNRAVFALGDSTGHGVPGALMSMLGVSLLNEIVVENKIFKADLILNKLREKVIAALTKEGAGTAQDGMDMALCVWNKLDNTLEFAGANNGMWLMRDGRVTEYAGNKMPIGKYVTMDNPFSSTVIQLQKGDIIYLSTDGFADQFGGPKGKKFKYKPLIQLLETNSNDTMEQQRAVLKQELHLWKGDFDQVDDISLIGLKI